VDVSNVVVFSFGVLLMSVVLAISFSVSRPNRFQYFILRVVLSLAAAAIAAGIPGFLNLQIGGVLRAGGALGIFVLVYAFNPPSMIKRGSPSKSYNSEKIS
jgi:hypothetical protein